MHPRWALVGALAFALLSASPAAAEYTLPPDNSGADQYVPPVPDAGGSRPSGPGTGTPGSLAPNVRASLPAGTEGRVLARLATDPGSGAPSAGARGSSGGGRGAAAGGGTSAGANSGGGGGRAHEADVTAASAITSSVSDNPGVGILAGGILVLTLGAGGLGLVQRRRRT